MALPAARLFPLVTAAFVLAMAPAWAQGGDPVKGRALAVEWCSRCHVVAPNQRPTDDVGVPSFMRIAADRKLSRRDMIDLITIPHLRMPPPVLTVEEAEHVVAYILWLRM